jgi:predicted transport protein
MAPLKYIKPERIWLKGNSEFDEKWIQERIADDPALLGLGDVAVRDKERMQPTSGRLDLLLQDTESDHRFEVEIQLGKTDESHIVRTIEYWDIERKRYPQYEHTAVIVAEDITSRFLNVIGLFNGFIPLIAIQMQALKTGDQVSLVFTTVLNEMRLGLIDEDEGVQEPADRTYWEERSSKTTLAMADHLLELVKSFDNGFALKYNRGYIGLARNGQPNNFVVLNPKKNWLRINVRLEHSDEIQSRLDEAGLDVMGYGKFGRYKIRLAKDDIKRHEELLLELLKASYEQFGQ